MNKDAKRISEQELDKVAGGELGWDIYDPLQMKRDKEPSSLPLLDQDPQKLIKDPPCPLGGISVPEEDVKKLIKKEGLS